MILHDRDGLMQVSVSEDLQQLFRRLRWSQTFQGHERLHVGYDLLLRDGARLAPYVGFYAGGSLPEFGAFSYCFSELDRGCTVGAYCSISWHVAVMGISHPLHCFSTTAALYENHKMFEAAYHDAGATASYLENPQKPWPVIGNDVWIGQNVLLARGITIGDGAVIAAGSVVVKDVAPYAVVGGSPARTIKFRFSERQQELLQRSRWWDYAVPGLMRLKVGDIEEFVDGLASGVSDGSVRKVVTMDEPLTDIIRRGGLSVYMPEGVPLTELAKEDFRSRARPDAAAGRLEASKPVRGRVPGFLSRFTRT